MKIVPTDYKTPGQLIDALLTERGWHKRVLAIILGIDDSGVNRIVSDKRAVDAPLAIALEEVFGVPAEMFLDLQKSYDLARARIIARPDPKRAARAQLFGGLPVAEMIKRGWLDAENPRDVAEVERAMSRFFKVESGSEVEILPHAAKKTEVLGSATFVQLAWLYRVREIASEMLVPKFTQHSGRKALERLSLLLAAAEEARHVPRILAESGIRFVVVESLTGAKIDGACMWLDEHSPVIGMSLRHDRIDNFWFVLRHELEHVLQGHGRQSRQAILDAELEGENAGTGANVSEEERVANAAAADFCVPQKKLDAFVARKAPFFAERDLLGFAKTINVHPGLIAGQLQHRTGRYDRFRAHLSKIRSIVAPSAMVDGWGDVAPVGL
ncbi:DNA-binding protein [Pandoraea horticolens]|uniref:DNA-binding protein n=1 Tax=Pandoraea horticolens TaxID=2508298 RepID=A0A5E4VXS0_9BURK|nr:helix-turn-helix domain-containing protein [Pandoraea horticolens]VVE16663.1 DNA-binding protein [Pandoraea horticolens]